VYLAIDTSTETASLAIVQENSSLVELTWNCRQNHSVELMPNIVRLLELVGTSMKSICGIIVAKGPGSFNGLRVGISTAKGLAFSLGIPIVGIDSIIQYQPDYVLILSWNFKEEIIAKLRPLIPNAKYIIPIPKLEVI